MIVLPSATIRTYVLCIHTYLCFMLSLYCALSDVKMLFLWGNDAISPDTNPHASLIIFVVCIYYFMLFLCTTNVFRMLQLSHKHYQSLPQHVLKPFKLRCFYSCTNHAIYTHML